MHPQCILLGMYIWACDAIRYIVHQYRKNLDRDLDIFVECKLVNLDSQCL